MVQSAHCTWLFGGVVLLIMLSLPSQAGELSEESQRQEFWRGSYRLNTRGASSNGQGQENKTNKHSTGVPSRRMQVKDAEQANAPPEEREAASAPRPSFSEFADSKDPEAPPKYELVLARFNEDIGWLAQIPDFWKITIYNKGPADQGVREVPGREFTVVNIPNQGREGETYMHHILLRWDTLANYTVFSQGWPFIHGPHVVDLLKHPHLLGPVQCMSLLYTANGHPDNVTPKEVVEGYRKHPWYRAERFSLRTLDSIYFTDMGATNIARRYLEMHGLNPGTNIIAHHFDIIGLNSWVPHEQEIGSFGYGGLFGVHVSKIKRHPQHVYQNMRASLVANDLHAWVGERMYLMMFGGSYIVDV